MYSCSEHGILEFNNGFVMGLSVDNILGDTILLLLTC